MKPPDRAYWAASQADSAGPVGNHGESQQGVTQCHEGTSAVDRGVDRRPENSQHHVCFHSSERVASLLAKRGMRTSVLLLIRWFRGHSKLSRFLELFARQQDNVELFAQAWPRSIAWCPLRHQDG